jgi:hypothetical protein
MKKEKKVWLRWNEADIEVEITYNEIDTSFIDSEGVYYRNYIHQTELELVEILPTEEGLAMLTETERVEFLELLNMNQDDIFNNYVVNA